MNTVSTEYVEKKVTTVFVHKGSVVRSRPAKLCAVDEHPGAGYPLVFDCYRQYCCHIRGLCG